MRGRWRNIEHKQFEKAIVSRACPPKNVSISALACFALSLVVVVLGGLQEAVADEGIPIPLPERSHKEPMKNLFSLALGGALWPSLGNKDFETSGPKGSGQLSSAGLAFETAYQRHMAHWEQGDLYLGAEFGAFILNNKNSDNTTHPSTGQPIKGDLDARAFYAGPSIKFMMGEGRFKYFLGAGSGYYHLDLTESEEVPRPPCTNYGPCSHTNRSLSKGTIGGYVSLGVDVVAVTTQSGWEWRVRLEDKIHLVNFGSLDSFSPGAGNLSGPINVIQIGVVTGF